MSTDLRPEEVELKTQARSFAQDAFQDAPDYDREERFPSSVWKAAGESGLLGAFIPAEYGGRGIGYLGHTLVMEEFWRVDPGMGNILLAVFGAELLMAFGSEAQKSRWLPMLANGSAISCCAITEPDAGSDIFAISTSGVREQDGWHLTGSKQFITNANRADLILVLAVTDSNPEKRTAAFSFFLVEGGAPGLTAEKMTNKLGIRCSDTAELALNDVVVPEDNLLGQRPGYGFHQVMQLFNINRLYACGQGVGVAQGGLDAVLNHLGKRPDKAVSQMVQYKLAEMATSVNAARKFTIGAGISLDRGRVSPGEIAMAKLFAGETGVQVVREALSIVGSDAVSNEHPLSRFYRDAKIVEIYEGSKDIEKLTIAREILDKSAA